MASANSGDGGRGGQPGTGSGGGAGGEHGTFSGGATNGGPGTLGTGDTGGIGATSAPAVGGEGGGGGGGYYGGGGGGGGAASGSGFVFAGSGGGGGGGGGSSLVPGGGPVVLEFSTEPEVVISYGVIAFTSGSPPSGTAAQRYSYTYTSTGDTGIAYAVTAGALPPGLSLSSVGALSGTPTAPGSYTFTVTASGTTATQSRQDTISIAAAPAVSPGGAVAGSMTSRPTLALLGPAVASPSGVSFSMSCQAATGTICNLRGELSTLEKLFGSKVLALTSRKKRHSQSVIIGQSAFTLPAGQTRRVFMPLNATGRKLLKHFGKLPATLTITLLNASPPTVVQTTTTIKQKQKQRKHQH